MKAPQKNKEESIKSGDYWMYKLKYEEALAEVKYLRGITNTYLREIFIHKQKLAQLSDLRYPESARTIFIPTDVDL